MNTEFKNVDKKDEETKLRKLSEHWLISQFSTAAAIYRSSIKKIRCQFLILVSFFFSFHFFARHDFSMS